MDLPAAVRGPARNTAVEVFGPDDDIVGYRRSPSDVLRADPLRVATVALLALTRWAESTVSRSRATSSRCSAASTRRSNTR